MRVNRAWLDELIALAAEYRANEGIAPPSLDGMLALRGVIEAAEQPEDGADSGQDDAAMLETLDAALAELVGERQAEGAQLAAALTARIEEIETLTRQAEALMPSRQEALSTRLREQVAALVDAGAPGSGRAPRGGARDAGRQDRRDRGDRPPEVPLRGSGAPSAGGRRRRPQARFPRPGVQPGGPTRSAPRPPTPRSRTSASRSRPPSTSSASRCRTWNSR